MGDYNRVIISGNCPGSTDQWSVGLCYGSQVIGANLDDLAELEEWADLIVARITAFPAGTLLQLLSTSGSITGVRTEYRLGDDSLQYAAETTLSKAGTGTANKVLQAALVISLRTSRVGRSYRGRVYWPAWNYTPVAGALTVDPTVRSGLLNDFAALAEGISVDALAADPTSEVSLRVRSSTLNSETLVTELQVGSVLDTQRRRRDDTVEVYSSLPYPAP